MSGSVTEAKLVGPNPGILRRVARGYTQCHYTHGPALPHLIDAFIGRV